MKEYSITVYEKDGEKIHSDNMTRDQASKWIQANINKGLSFTVSEWINGNWIGNLTAKEVRSL